MTNLKFVIDSALIKHYNDVDSCYVCILQEQLSHAAVKRMHTSCRVIA